MISNMLGLGPISRRADYMAGGRYQQKSYYAKVYALAAEIIEACDDYLGLRYWLTANVDKGGPQGGGEVEEGEGHHGANDRRAEGAEDRHLEERDDASVLAGGLRQRRGKDESTGPMTNGTSTSESVRFAEGVRDSNTAKTREEKSADPVSKIPWREQILDPAFEKLQEKAVRAILEADRAGHAWLDLVLDHPGTTSSDERANLLSPETYLEPRFYPNKLLAPYVDVLSLTEDCTVQTAKMVASNKYRSAFDACRALTRFDRRGLVRIPVIKQFYERSYEAMQLLSVFENVMEDVEKIRAWLLAQPACSELTREMLFHEGGTAQSAAAATSTGGGGGTRTAAVASSGGANINHALLLRVLVEAMYFFPEDRKVLLTDPMALLLLKEPAYT